MPRALKVGASEVEKIEKTVVLGYGEVIFSFYQGTKLAQWQDQSSRARGVVFNLGCTL